MIIIAKLKQLFKIDTDRTQPGREQLCLRIGERHFAYSVTDLDSNSLVALAYYTSQQVEPEGMSSIFVSTPVLTGNFESIKVGYDHPYSVLTPVKFYDAEQSGRMLDTMFGKHEGLALLSEQVTEWQLRNEYAVSREVHEWLRRKYPSATFHHNYSVGIRLPSTSSDRLLVDIHSDRFSMIAIKNNKLCIAQTFAYSTPADLLYHLLRVCEQFNLSQREVELSIAGLIEKDSALFRELHQYFLDVRFREPEWKFSNENIEYPLHFFTPLNDLARCAS